MFIDIFMQLCSERGVSANKACIEIGLARTAVAKWKNGAVPQGQTLEKIADYFNVSTDYLLGKEKSTAVSDEDTEMLEMLEELKNNPGMRVLFSKTKNASKEDIEKVIKMLDIMKGES